MRRTLEVTRFVLLPFLAFTEYIYWGDANVTLPCVFRAYVVVTDPKTITAEEIVEWVAKQVSSHKRLRGGVVLLDVVPKSPSGKILRNHLRVLVREQDGKALARKL